VLEQKKKELKDFMTRKIAHLIEEQEKRLKLFRTRNLDVKIERMQEGAPTQDREEVLPLNPMKESQQHKVTMPKGDKNQSGKRNTETKITRNKARKLSKKRAKLQNVPEGTSQKEDLQNWNFIGISEQRNMALPHGEEI
jgi:hypothetical protein